MLLVYLDQWCFGHLRLPEHQRSLEELRALVQASEVLCPASICHALETGSCKDLAVRGELLSALQDLSRGHTTPMLVELWHLERDALEHPPSDRRAWVRERTASAVVQGVLSVVPLMDPYQFEAVTKPQLEAAARASTDGRDLPWNELRDDLAKAVALDPSRLPATRESFMEAFPSQVVRLALDEVTRKRRAKFTTNDLFDYLALSSTFPYYDVTAADGTTAGRLREAQTDGRAPTDGAAVVSSIEELMEAVRERVS